MHPFALCGRVNNFDLKISAHLDLVLTTTPSELFVDISAHIIVRRLLSRKEAGVQ